MLEAVERSLERALNLSMIERHFQYGANPHAPKDQLAEYIVADDITNPPRSNTHLVAERMSGSQEYIVKLVEPAEIHGEPFVQETIIVEPQKFRHIKHAIYQAEQKLRKSRYAR